MKDNEQKDDYYSVSKQPPMPMGAPAPPPPMPMDPSMGGMPMPPMGGGMPPGAPMPPQEEELQEGEYMDPVTGKVMRRGEEFSVDPDRELDDTKNIAKWFDTLKKNVSYLQPGTIQATPAMQDMRQQTAIEEAEEALAKPEANPKMRDRLFNRKKYDDAEWDRHEANAKLDAAKRGKEYYRSFGQYDSPEDAQRAVDNQEPTPGYNELAAKYPDSYTPSGHMRRIPGMERYVSEDKERDFSDWAEVERMPHPEVEGEDSHDTMEGGAGYGQGAYTSLYEDTPDWFKNVQG